MKSRVFSLAMLSGSMDDDIIIPFLDGLLEAGYQGVCPHPRNGLKIPYPSRLYWQKLSRMIGLAQQRGLEIWHYDEFPYPSGQLAGIMTEDHPHMAAQTLVFEPIEITANREGYIDIGRGSLLALVRYKETRKSTFRDIQDVTADTGILLDSWLCLDANNLGYTATKRLHREDHERAFPKRASRYYVPEAPMKATEKLIAIRSNITSYESYQGLRKPDLTRPEVTDYFATRVYTQLSELGKKHHLINTPIFQDEVTFYSSFPWNDIIEKSLLALWGKDFGANLWKLNNPDIPGWEWARFQYRNLCAELLEQNWYIKIKDCCHENELRMTGHLPGEESISGHAQIMGNAFKNLSHFDIPGYDIISSTLPDDIDRSHATGIKLVQSAAWIEGRKSTMAEAFGANGFYQDLQRNRTVIAWLAAHDIKQICDHATFSDSRSVVKYDAPPIHNRFNPMHKGASDLWNWHHWLCDLMDHYQFNPTTLVLFPFDALTRYTTLENYWESQTTLLESFFHYLCMHSLDCVFLPSHLLSEVEVAKSGFTFRSHRYENFVVPPFCSLHESTFTQLKKLQITPGFSWILPEEETGISIFGENHPESTFREITAFRTKSCSEEDMINAGSRWFDDVLHSPLEHIRSAKSVMKSLRLDSNTRERLLVLINPHDEAIEVSAPHFGKAMPQPPEDARIQISKQNLDTKVLLPPRATAVFEYDKEGKYCKISPNIIFSKSSKWRITGKNYWNLKTGKLHLQNYDEVAFSPGAVSTLWNLSDASESPIHITTELETQLNYTAEFPMHIDQCFSHLSFVLDIDSMPPDAAWFWDDEKLLSKAQDVFETKNNVYVIPPKLLTAGEHQLRMESTVINGAQGIMERPILFGDFEIAKTEPLHLAPLSHEWRSGESTFPLWQEAAMPEAFGPAEYEFEFDIPSISDAQLELPTCIGVAEISINGKNLCRNNWEPRIIPISKVLLREGKNTVKIMLHGSWNNIFSHLNKRENGLREAPILRVY
jgi:hypothetical protein